MAGTLSSYDRNRTLHGGAADEIVRVGDRQHHYRYYATQKRPRRYSSFSIMNWFRRSKRYDDDDDDGGGGGKIDSAWFRDDLKRIQQAYRENEPDYVVVTPIAQRRRRPTAAATWSKWSGSTTTVYSFAYVDGICHQGNGDDDDHHHQQRVPSLVNTVDDVVEYIDAATLPVSRWRSDRGQCPSSVTGKSLCKKSSPTVTTATGTMTATAKRRYNKKAAPLPPPPVAVAGPSSSAGMAKTSMQRRTVTMARQKYRAPQPPMTTAVIKTTTSAELRPPQQKLGRPGVPPHRHRKGPAPKPPVGQPAKPDRPAAIVESETDDVDGGRPRGSNVRRKITQYEKERLMERVDKIEKHFLRGEKVVLTAAAVVQDSGKKSKPTTITNISNGFTSVAALYTAMAATNLTELDKRAAEICRLNRLKTAPSSEAANAIMSSTSKAVKTIASSVPVATVVVPRQPAVITSDHKNAIVTAVIRKSYPTTVAKLTTTTDGRQPVLGGRDVASSGTPSKVNNITVASVKTAVSDKTEADDEKQIVRHKRLAFFQQRLVGAQQIHDGGDGINGHATATVSSTSDIKSSLGTQTTGSVVVSKIPLTSSKSTGHGTAAIDKSGSECSTGGKKFSPEYHQLMAMEMQSDLVLHNGPFECAVCLCTYDNNGVVLRDCLHVFCRPCLQLTISHSNAEQVECPYMDDRYSCKGVLQHREIKKILDSDEEYERFLQRSVDRARQLLAKDRDGGSFQCRRPDCTGWCLIYDKNNVFEFKCPVCGTVTCVKCGSIHKYGRKCKIFRENNDNDDDGKGMLNYTVENLIERGDAMPCPGCNTILSKQQGCDWIKCAVCFMEICWATKGPRWGPNGKGDTTAGCQCDIPAGRRCHVDCKYCH
ncbi:RING-type zinc-finger, LisH dimerisation motif,Zinc finger, RING-type,Zinc finger, RING/FYVE/PHD- [Cinara cedri]|uniref:RING-type zinc-finger, LisH dimerisation motif,Zinc finger, RING-type,Zinc finger, RING/FYVE/PHD n=1 Tax=Cinara cedri TaxID=506608 RepID=A0A5E4NCW3_9HEMI|nr:RING-type zinc-finger, LisH dimerisation motif,Zinc finger, RING-type,Zinc finger, RING/FYVE/PHD- [Cinara cedri]